MADRDLGSLRVNRRGFVKGSALASGAFFINSKFNHLRLADEPASPFTTPWVQPLPFAPYKVPLPSFAPLDPLPDFSSLQRYDEFPAVDQYLVDVCETMACGWNCRLQEDGALLRSHPWRADIETGQPAVHPVGGGLRRERDGSCRRLQRLHRPATSPRSQSDKPAGLPFTPDLKRNQT